MPVKSIKFSSDKCNQITTGKDKEKVPLFEESDDWVLRFDLAYNEDGSDNRPFPAHIATTGNRPDGILFSDKLLTMGR